MSFVRVLVHIYNSANHVNKLIDVFLEFPIVSAGKQNQRNKQIYWFAAADWF